MDTLEVQNKSTHICSDEQMLVLTGNPSSTNQQIEREEGKVSVGNVVELKLNVVPGIDCSSKSVQVPVKNDVGQESDVTAMDSLEVLNESTHVCSDEQMLVQIGNPSRTNQENELHTLIRISQHNKPKKSYIAQVVPQDYMCTREDVEIIQYMKSAPGKRILVDIDSAWGDRNDMECLFHDNMQLNGEVISAYIHCIRDEEHLLHREGGNVFLENTFISTLLKRDGDPKVPISYNEDVIDKRVDNYLLADMVFLPINIERCHWYLAVVNAKKCEVHVLDSMGLEFLNRRDLKTTLKGLERQIKLVAEHKELNREKWLNLDVSTWPVIEKILERMQTDGTSCGLWMLNFMEYWTGSSLSDNVTQDDITNFRFKLPVILWDSRLNTKKGYQELEQANDDKGSPSDVEIIDTPAEAPQPSKASHQTELDVSPCVLSTGITTTNTQELLCALCTYIMSIDHAESLEKEWIRTTKPYPISLSLKKLRDILDVNKPMGTDCFNVAVRMLACNEALFMLEDKYYYMDLQFCSISDFPRDPHYGVKRDIKRLAKLFEGWPDMEYDVSHCSNEPDRLFYYQLYARMEWY